MSFKLNLSTFEEGAIALPKGDSSLPHGQTLSVGAGLSSSAAIVCASAAAVMAAHGLNFSQVNLLYSCDSAIQVPFLGLLSEVCLCFSLGAGLSSSSALVCASAVAVAAAAGADVSKVSSRLLLLSISSFVYRPIQRHRFQSVLVQ